MKNDILQQIGLSDHEITVYTTLLEHGPQKAGVLTKKTDLKRGLVYKLLEDLLALELIEKDEQSGPVAIFNTKHPSALKDLADKKAREVTRAQNILENELGSIISTYNLATGKPGIEFYEGEEGIEKVLADSLTTKETILTYVDIEAIDKHIPTINKEYSKKRDRLKINKRGIVLDTPYAQEVLSTYYSDTTTSRVISAHDAPPFTSTMQIYDGKISYISFKEKMMVGTIISDQSLYDMHKYLFEFTWSKARSVFPK